MNIDQTESSAATRHSGAIPGLVAAPVPGEYAGSSAAARRWGPVARHAAAAIAVIALLTALAWAVMSLRGDGFRFITVTGSSMGDAIPIGSLVVARWHDGDDVHLGDVILVREETEAGMAAPKLHRVIKVEMIEGQRVVMLKGDANETADPGKFTLPDRVLVSDSHVPYLGYVIGMLATPVGWVLTVALPLVALALLMVASIWRTPKPAED